MGFDGDQTAAIDRCETRLRKVDARPTPNRIPHDPRAARIRTGRKLTPEMMREPRGYGSQQMCLSA
jgi:hypothetical protein